MGYGARPRFALADASGIPLDGWRMRGTMYSAGGVEHGERMPSEAADAEAGHTIRDTHGLAPAGETLELPDCGLALRLVKEPVASP